MADIVSPEKRSQNMSAIRSKNTKPEVYLRKLLFAQGYRYRIADKSVPGHPDIFLRKYNTAIFVNGCFWHRHSGCKYAYQSNEFEIVYAIIDTKDSSIEAKLPFFSKVNLMITAQELDRMHFKFSICSVRKV